MRHLILLPLLAAAACIGDSEKVTDSGKAGGGSSNTAPVADAGQPISQTADTAVQLNGTGSLDADGDALTYIWSFDSVPEGSSLPSMESPFSKNHTTDASAPTFTADRVGTYIVKLVVNDGKLDSVADYVIVTVSEPENLPVADAGPDLSAEAGAAVTLDGTDSYDPLARPLTYTWTLVDQPAASAISVTGTDSTLSFTPDARGVYTVNLVVSNGLVSSNADAATVTVTGDDSAPTANAGEDQDSAYDCTTLSLDCSGSTDPDGDELQYLWEVQAKPSASTAGNDSFSDRSAAKPTFWPDAAGTYVLSCSVYDGKTWSSPDTTTIQAAERPTNTDPIADAGSDTTVSGGSAECTESGYTFNCDECAAVTVTLGSDAAASDPDSDPYTVLWTVVEGTATIADPNSLVTTVEMSEAEPEEPGECEDVDYVFELAVTDCTGETETDTVIFTVTCCGVEDT
jgi:hypothetical protein